MKNSISSVRFDIDYANWHICSHDVCSDHFQTTQINAGEVEQNVEDFKVIGKDNDGNQIKEE